MLRADEIEALRDAADELTRPIVEGARDEVINLIDSLQIQYELEAKKEVIIDLYKKQYEAQERIANAQETLTKATKIQYQFVAQLNRRTIFSEMIEEAKLRQASSGVNPFLLGRG